MGKKQRHLILFTLLAALFSFHAHAQTTVEKIAGEWALLVDGKPYDLKGATFGYGDDYSRYFQELNSLGVNTIRLWGAGPNTPQLLDAAHAHGIKVMVGIWMRHGLPGMEADDRFDYLNDTAGKEAMYAGAIATVEKYKDHPAVLTWGVGNEVYLNTATDAEKEAYSRLLERICSNIKAIDPAHPVTSVEAWTFGLDWWQKYVPSIDIYGLNSYGPGAGFLSAELEKRGIDKPYIVTEFGVTGEWDVQEDQNGVKVEPSDQQKYDAIVKGYKEWINNKPACLGAFIFHYGSGDDFTAAWLLTHYEGKTRPAYWAIREAYTGKPPVNTIPRIESFQLPDATMESGAWAPVTLDVSDSEQEELAVRFYYNQRSGSRKRRNQIVPLNSRGSLAEGFAIQLPREDGAIKVYVHVEDTYHNLGIASTSIVVQDEEARQRKYLVPRASLPFYVYQDNGDLPYAPSGYMGNYSAIEVDLDNTEEVHTGETAIKISYNARDNWYGVGFVDPANDWGDLLGGYDLSGAKTFSFWAKTKEGQVEAKVGFGLIDKDKPFPDSGKQSIDITLTDQWKKFTIKIKKTDLSCIRSGLVLFSSSDGFAQEIYLDEVVFE